MKERKTISGAAVSLDSSAAFFDLFPTVICFTICSSPAILLSYYLWCRRRDSWLKQKHDRWISEETPARYYQRSLTISSSFCWSMRNRKGNENPAEGNENPLKEQSLTISRPTVHQWLHGGCQTLRKGIQRKVETHSWNQKKTIKTSGIWFQDSFSRLFVWWYSRNREQVLKG